MSEPPVAPDDTPTRLQQWQSWSQFMFLGGGPVLHPDDREQQKAICVVLDAETAKLKKRAELAEADVSRLQQENALLRRSLEMLTKQMAQDR